MNKIVLEQLEQIKKQNGILLTCQRCGYNWKYNGANPFVASCPFCKTSVRVYKKHQ